jgi:hypothetical protein
MTVGMRSLLCPVIFLINSNDRVTTTGAATHGRVRRFGVATSEDIPAPE